MDRPDQASPAASRDAWMGPRAVRVARRLEPWMLGAALLTIPTIAVEEAAQSQAGYDAALALNWFIWLAFLGEAVTMLVLVHDRWRWLRTHPLEVAIVILTPPLLLPCSASCGWRDFSACCP